MKSIRAISLSISALVVVLLAALFVTGNLGGSPSSRTAEAINLAAAPGTFTSTIVVQNPNAEAAFVVIGFFDGAGTRVKDVSNTIAGGQNWEVSLSGVEGLGTGRYSAVVESDKPVKAVTNLTSTGPTTADAYSATADSEAGTTVYSAAILRNVSGFSTSLTIQNANASGDVNVTVEYRRSDGSVATTDTTNNLRAGAAVTFDQGNDSRLGDSFVGDAIITSNGKIAVVTSVYNPGGTGLFGSFNATAAAPQSFVPVVGRVSGITTGIIVQNAQTDRSVDVTVTYGNGATSGPSAVPAGGHTVFLTSTAPVPDGWAGPAKVTANGNIVAVAIILLNQGGLSRFSIFSGFGDGSTQISLPNLSKAAGGVSSIVAVQNAGSSAADITIRFSTGQVQTATGVQPNALAVFSLGAIGELPAGWTGNAMVTSAQKVVGIGINNDESTPSGDLLRMYKSLQ